MHDYQSEQQQRKTQGLYHAEHYTRSSAGRFSAARIDYEIIMAESSISKKVSTQVKGVLSPRLHIKWPGFGMCWPRKLYTHPPLDASFLFESRNPSEAWT